MNDTWTSANMSRESRKEGDGAEWKSGEEEEKEVEKSSASSTCPSHFIHLRIQLKCASCVCLSLVCQCVLHFSVCVWKPICRCSRSGSSNLLKAFLITALCFRQLYNSVFFFCVCFFSPARSDPLHQWDEREHSPAGGHAVWAHGQLQLGGGLQSPYHHPPPHDVRQRGRRLAHKHTHKHIHTNKNPPGQSMEATSISHIITQVCLAHTFINTNTLG